MRTRMSWDWVLGYPIFVYTTFLDHFLFSVKIVKGVKGNQNATGFGPSAPAWIEYEQKDMASKNEVVSEALRRAKDKIREELCH